MALQNENEVAQSTSDRVEEISLDDSYLLLGKLAVRYKFATVEQIKQALIQKQQEQAGQNLLLGQFLVSQKILTQSQLVFLHSVQKLLATRESDNRFAVFAVKNDFVTQEQVDLALLEQKRQFKLSKTVRSIEDILVESGVLEEQKRDAILIRLKGLHSKRAVNNNSQKSATDHAVDLQDHFELDISKDHLKAFIKLKCSPSDSITVRDIKHFLQNQEIQFGWADDAKIACYLENLKNDDQPFKIAEGQPPDGGQDARIKYFFDTDPLSIDGFLQKNTIDFTEVKDIPAVKKGQLVAEKIPAQEGCPGMDIYGRPVAAPKPADINIRLGKGTTISEDGLKVFSDTEGVPAVSIQGRLFVLPRLEISGDVGLKTGHPDFQGHLHVTGSVQNGYRIKAHSLIAGEILKAEVQTAGDIVTTGGIIGATIHAGGNIRAIFVREAEIKTFGDVVVKKGIRDSKIETSGACIIEKGTILSSTITAKKGIWAGNIGSEISKPCCLSVGVDIRAGIELDKIEALVAEKNKKLHKLKDLIKELDQKSKDAENKIGQLAQLQDRTMVEQRSVQSDIEQLKSANNDVQLASAQAALRELDTEVAEMEIKMETLFELQEQISNKITTTNQNIKSLETDVFTLEDKLSEITQWSSNGNGVPEVRVKDDIFPETTIDGVHSSLSLKRKLNNVLIKEHTVNGADNTSKHQFKISQL